jgi:hypothetical protein
MMKDFHLMLASPEMLRAGHMLPKIPRQILIICRPKPKTKEEMREMEAKGETGEMEEKGAKEEKGTKPENKSPAAKIYIFFIQFY